MIVPEEEYKLKFFVKRGFVRRRCKVCNSAFWTLNESRDVCGDAPCQDYTFIGRELKAGVDVSFVRKMFLDFFRGKGHEVIEPYPVVARWREDIYLTIASIAVFQPFVTDGVVPPPANPLVISQPCIRLVDIDNVGLTAGRHLTIFEMGGHHAFNYPDREVYWKEETVEYCHDFLINVVGVDEKAITYKEDFWVGGGNAGPDLEVCIDGLELATLVFMCFKVEEDNYIPMPIRIVDTGYGIERFTWFLSGKPTAFHAVYGNLVDRICSDADVMPPAHELLIKVAKASALMRVERGRTVDELRRELASIIGVPIKDLEKEIVPIEKVFALTDHAKCIAFMLADGIVPSNVGEGYLARLVIRRALKLCNSLGLEEGYLIKLVERQIEFWGNDYPKLLKKRNIVLEELNLEEEKFKELISRGRAMASRIVKSLEGKRIPTDMLLKLYDSHGLPPEVVKEEAEKHGMKIEVPDNFYGLVARLHQSPRVLKEEPRYDVSGLPPTKTLYYDNPRQLSFEAKVLRSGKGFVILDQTCFYPRGGGQEHDEGFIIFENSRFEVSEVLKIGDVILHLINGEVPEGAHVKGEVKAGRRLDLMRHHSATHVLLEAIRRVLGDHVWQAGAQKWPDRAHIDVTHYKVPTEEQIKLIESMANDVVFKNLLVKKNFVERDKAEKTYGLEIYQGGVVPGRIIRVVEIEGWNAQACGGMHVDSTGEIGLIKIIKVDKIQDGILRFEFKAGRAVLDYIEQLEKQLRSTAQVLECPLEQVPSVSGKLKLEIKQLRKEIEGLKSKVIEALIPSIAERYRRGEFIIDVELSGIDYEGMSMLSEKIIKEMKDVVLIIVSRLNDRNLLVVSCGREALSRGFAADKIAIEITRRAGGRAGGRREYAQGVVQDLKKAKEVIDELRNRLLTS
ncbi:MAG: alanine--tRNA ligase [Candidatus Nezhaarchaeota archaeon]|nr:alanine--tRNA ligase [Candidatus Nezhaarchaeota archaeon]MCX8142102.1 alanine--tRNA ligase [Candidatus Nezhaarchaeota archaeon]MDW8050117.1 alanine--tRNA ligase [Nitrososphaerota archaeon]